MAVDYVAGIGLGFGPIGGEEVDTSQQGSSHIAVEAAHLGLRWGQYLVAVAQILFDKLGNLLARILVGPAFAGVHDGFVEVRELFKDAQHIEVEVCPQRLHLGHIRVFSPGRKSR